MSDSVRHINKLADTLEKKQKHERFREIEQIKVIICS